MKISDADRVAYRALALAVLATSLDELRVARRLRQTKVEREVIGWINSDSDRYVFAFVPLCEWLGFDVGSLRKKLNRG